MFFLPVYKPGKANIVTDGLSRVATYVNHLGSDTDTAFESDSIATVHSALQNASCLIPHVEAPHDYRLPKSIDFLFISCGHPHAGYVRHSIPINDHFPSTLLNSLKKYLKPSVINGIKIPDDYLQLLQACCFQNFKMYKIRITQRLVEDITDEEQICEVIVFLDLRAHRNSKEVRIQILGKYYFPRMASIIRTQLSTCTTCKFHKYDKGTQIYHHYRRFHIGEKNIPELHQQIL